MSSVLLDRAVEAEAHVGARLDREPIIWLGTVSPRGQPHTVPVWFVWNDPTVTVFSQPGTVKLGHLRANSAVSLALDSSQGGTDVVLGEGRAELKGLNQVRDVLQTFARKYQPVLKDQPIEQWLETFSQPPSPSTNSSPGPSPPMASTTDHCPAGRTCDARTARG